MPEDLQLGMTHTFGCCLLGIWTTNNSRYTAAAALIRLVKPCSFELHTTFFKHHPKQTPFEPLHQALLIAPGINLLAPKPIELHPIQQPTPLALQSRISQLVGLGKAGRAEIRGKGRNLREGPKFAGRAEILLSKHQNIRTSDSFGESPHLTSGK